jgi:hypothetical protein
VSHVARIWEVRSTYKILVRKPEGKGSFGDLGLYERYNIKMAFKEVSGSY